MNGISKYKIFVVIYHFIFTFISISIYYDFSTIDSTLYWNLRHKTHTPSLTDFPLPFGNQFLRYLNYPFSDILNLPIEFGYFLYSFYSLIGLYYLYKFLRLIIKSNFNQANSNWIYLIFFTPSIHLWTSMIGKEAILFSCISIFIYHLSLNKLFTPKPIISLIIILIIRPHLFVLLTISYLLYFIINHRKNISKIAIATLTSVILTAFGIYFFTEATWVKNINYSYIKEILAFHQESFKNTYGYVPLQDYYYPIKIFTFYFRPFPLELNNIFGIVYGIENFIFFLLFIACCLISITYYRVIKFHNSFNFILIFSVVYASVFVLAYSNFGLIARTKILITPFICVIFLYIIVQLPILHHSHKKLN